MGTAGWLSHACCAGAERAKARLSPGLCIATGLGCVSNAHAAAAEPLPRAPAGEQVDDQQQDDRADEGGDQEADPAAAQAQSQCRQQPATQEAADDANHHIQDDALRPVTLHHQAGQPTGDATHDQIDEKIHFAASSLEWTEPHAAGRA